MVWVYIIEIVFAGIFIVIFIFAALPGFRDVSDNSIGVVAGLSLAYFIAAGLVEIYII